MPRTAAGQAEPASVRLLTSARRLEAHPAAAMFVQELGQASLPKAAPRSAEGGCRLGSAPYSAAARMVEQVSLVDSTKGVQTKRSLAGRTCLRRDRYRRAIGQRHSLACQLLGR